MKIKDIALSAAAIGERVVKAIAIGAVEVWSAVKYMVFKDPVVAQICATNFGDGVGITEEQAAAVTSVGTIFKGNTEITSFDELEKFGLTSVGETAFQQCSNLASIRYSQKVTYIGRKAFSKCSALAISLDSESITKVDQQAFENSGIVSINLPNATNLVQLAFQYCKQLRRVESIGSSPVTGNLFYGCSSLEYVNLPQGITSVSGNAFADCKSLKITPPTSLVNIGSAAFSGVPIEGELNLPNAITLGNGSFANTKITSAYIPKVIALGSATTGTNGIFTYCRSLSSVTLSEDLETIGAGAFYGCSSLVIEDLAFPKLKNMYAFAFHQTKIKRISNLGEIPSIDAQTFIDCINLSSIRIPSTVASIGYAAFQGCKSLHEVILYNSAPPTLGGNAFSSTPSDMTIYVHDQSVKAYREASGWSAYADRILPISLYEPTNE